MQNYGPALPTLRGLISSRPHDPFLPVYVAQLSGDVDLLRLYAGRVERADVALRCLVWMGRRDVVQALADAPEYPFHATARAILQDQTP